MTFTEQDQRVYNRIVERHRFTLSERRQLRELQRTAKCTLDPRFHILCSENTTRAGLSNWDITNAQYQIAGLLALS